MTFEDLGIKVQRTGLHSTTCPKCSSERKKEHQKTPCLSVNNEEGNKWWKCNHCGWSGNLSMHEKFNKVYESARMPKHIPDVYSKPVMDFFSKKQINPAIAKQLGVYERMTKTWTEVCFPFRIGYTLVNVKFRPLVDDKSVPKHYCVKKDTGSRETYWLLDKINFDENPDLTIVEGETDCLTHWTVGRTNVISVPMGAPNPNSDAVGKLAFAREPDVVAIINKARRIYLFTDNDANGIYLRDLLSDIYGKEKCYIINYPIGYKDSNEVYAGDVKKGLNPLGKSGIDKLYETAQPYPIKGIIRLGNVLEELKRIQEGGFKKGYCIGGHAVDELISLERKRLMVITGAPASGKSVWWRWYTTQICKSNKELMFAGYTPESRPMSREYAKIAEAFTGKRYHKEWHNSMSDIERHKAHEFIERHFILVNPNVHNFHDFSYGKSKVAPKGLKSILGYMKYLKQTMGIFGFWIDAWNKLDHQRPSGTPIEEFISKELDYLLEFLEVEELFCNVIAHPTKLETVRGGNYRKPTLYDIKGSSAWNEKVDIGVVLARNKFVRSSKKDDNGDEVWEISNDQPTLVSVEKMKFEELGQEGQVKMWLDKKNGNQFVTEDPAVKDTYESKVQKQKKVILNPEVTDDNETFDDIPF